MKSCRNKTELTIGGTLVVDQSAGEGNLLFQKSAVLFFHSSTHVPNMKVV